MPRAGDDRHRIASRQDAELALRRFIDRLIEDGWKKAGVKPARVGDATKSSCAEPISILLGRIPNVQEARAFLQTRESDKRAKLIEYLLEHPDFAKNFATQWTILLIGRGNQGRMVDRAALDELAAKAVRVRSALERGRP